MSSLIGEVLRLELFGASHAPAVGMTLCGVPAGETIDTEELRRFLARRAPGGSEWSSARREPDEPEIKAGIVGGVTDGTPITIEIRNTDARPSDYDALRAVPRPGHADYAAYVKYGAHGVTSGGGQFSGRMTAPLCAAGGICLQILARRGVRIVSRIAGIGDVRDEGELTESVSVTPFGTISAERGEEMKAAIAAARSCGDSLGGIVECAVFSPPAGLGGPLFDGMESRIAAAVFGIPAVKGIEFGAGFASSALRGSENNDAFIVSDGRIKTATNNCGGILGGVTDGMPLVFRAAFKPTPSIAKAQTSVDLETMRQTTLEIRGRHDPCIVPRALPCVESACAICVYDALLGAGKEGEAK